MQPAVVIRLFNEKAERLRHSALVRQASESGWRLSGEEGGPLRFERTGPDDDAIDAFVLTLRFFIQNNEEISLSNMSKLIASLPVQQSLKDEYEKHRAAINGMLDAPLPGFRMTVNGETLPARRIMETFVYGDRAHMNPTKRVEFEGWREGLPFPALEELLVGTLWNVGRGIYAIRKLNERIAAELEQASNPATPTSPSP